MLNVKNLNSFFQQKNASKKFTVYFVVINELTDLQATRQGYKDKIYDK
jgi:hypothetical protein